MVLLVLSFFVCFCMDCLLGVLFCILLDILSYYCYSLFFLVFELVGCLVWKYERTNMAFDGLGWFNVYSFVPALVMPLNQHKEKSSEYISSLQVHESSTP